MLAIEESQNLSLSNLSSLTLFTGSDQGQFEVMKDQVLKQLGYDPADLNFAYFDMKEVAYKDVELELVSLPFFADEKIVILDHFADITTAKKRFLAVVISTKWSNITIFSSAKKGRLTNSNSKSL